MYSVQFTVKYKLLETYENSNKEEQVREYFFTITLVNLISNKEEQGSEYFFTLVYLI